MANLKEDNTWEQGIYQLETSDPVMGGPNGIDNVPTRQLANRTLWLKNQLAEAVASINANKTAADQAYALKATAFNAGVGLTGGGTLSGNRTLGMGKPSKITATSTDVAVSDTHSHSIDKASTTVAGIVQLVNALNSTAADQALTAAQGKVLGDMITSLGGEAFKLRGTLGSRNLDDLKGDTNFGAWYMSANAGATAALNYPIGRAGTLLVLPAAYQGIQLYIPFDRAQIYIRHTDGNGVFGAWRIIGEVFNTLTSTSTTAALSAAQGAVLQDTKADKTINIIAGNGLTGGGTLGGNRTVALGNPGKITASSTNSVGTATHTHEIDNASTTVAGVVKLNDTLSSQSAAEALTANQGRLLNNSKADKADIKFSRPVVASGSVSITLDLNSRSSIQTALGDSYINFGYNQLVLHNASNSNITGLPLTVNSGVQLDIQIMGVFSTIRCHYLPLNRIFFTRVNWNSEVLGINWVEDLSSNNGVMLEGNQDIVGAKTFAARQSFLTGLQAASSKTDFDAGLRITFGANANDAWVKNETANKFLALKNNGELHYGGHKVYTAEYKPSWTNDITNKPTTVAASGLTDAATKTEVSNAATALKNEILGGAGAAFDTLKELAAALGNDANFAQTITAELAKKADKATTLAGYGLSNAIAVITGTIADGGTIPLPSGFSAAQCKWFVSLAEDNPARSGWDINENGANGHYRIECAVNENRKVTVGAFVHYTSTLPGTMHKGVANYIVIGYK